MVNHSQKYEKLLTGDACKTTSFFTTFMRNNFYAEQLQAKNFSKRKIHRKTNKQKFRNLW